MQGNLTFFGVSQSTTDIQAGPTFKIDKRMKPYSIKVESLHHECCSSWKPSISAMLSLCVPVGL